MKSYFLDTYIVIETDHTKEKSNATGNKQFDYSHRSVKSLKWIENVFNINQLLVLAGR